MPLTSAHELFEWIDRSGLLTADLLAPYTAAGRNGSPDPAALLARMVDDRLLTRYQAGQLSAGRTAGFFLTGKYKLLDHLGSGGMGHVYLCEHLLLARLVALKVLQPVTTSDSNVVLERFFREARAVAQLDHPNIARVFDMDRVGPTPFMVMEFIDGTNLHQLVSERGPLSIKRVVAYTTQVARGLSHASAAGLVHRDIKPGNLLLDRTGTVKILDLGLARFHSDVSKNNNLTATYDDRSAIGTADFMAPEQTLNSSAVDIRADLYSLGCTAYFLLSGRLPFEGGTIAQKLLWHQLRAPQSVTDFRPDVPLGLVTVLNRLLAKDPNLRYATPNDLIASLSALGGATAPPPSPDEMPKATGSSYRLGLTPMAAGGGDTSTMKALADPTATTDTDGSARSALTPPDGKRDSAFSDLAASGPRPPSAVRPPHSVESPPSPGAEQPSRLRRRIVFAVVQILFLAVGFAAAWLIRRQADQPYVNPAARQFPPTSPPLVEFTLKSRGSTFVQRFVEQWNQDYKPASGVTADYPGGGSGAGITGVLSGELDFGCSDVFLTDAQLKEAQGRGMDLVHIPVALGAVVPVYNLKEVKSPLFFSGPLLADIYLGRVTRWNDERIQAENKLAELPPVDIQVVYRKEGSGTTFIWTEFLSKTSESWREAVGADGVKQLKDHPVGEAVEGNKGVAEKVGNTDGAIGYVELAFALEKGSLNVGWVKNASGKYVRPTAKSVQEAVDTELKRLPHDLRYSLTNVAGEGSYPIAGTTWAVFNANHPDREQLLRVVEYLTWATHEGQLKAESLYYVPLPPGMVELIDGKLQKVRNKKEKGK